MAIIKVIDTIDTPAPFFPGSPVRFEISVINQGTLNAFDIDVLDSAPTGLSIPTLVPGQSGVTQNAAGDFTVGSLGVGSSFTFEVEAFIDEDFRGTQLINDAEITGASDVVGGADAIDVDSTPAVSYTHLTLPTIRLV